MSSPSSTLSPEKLGSRYPKQSSRLASYHQTIYHGFRSCQIVESRRRSMKVHDIAPTNSSQSDRLPSSSMDTRPRSESSAAVDLQCYPSRQSTSCLRTHVTFNSSVQKTSKGNATVIINEAKSAAMKDPITGHSGQNHAELTPPPTPRIGRLATPELSDLEDGTFCDCGVDAHVIKYCKTCNQELGLRHH